MCRFVLYVGNPISLSSLLTEPENSLIHQSFASRERAEPLNGDGFGVVWYVPDMSGDAAQFRMITPAWSNQNLVHLARVTRSGCVLAHVRAATPGLAVAETNAHPFVSGRYAFMHNGEVAGFPKIKRALLDRLGERAYEAIRGTTDSEHLFALALDHLLREDRLGEPHEALARALVAAVGTVLELRRERGITEPSTLNLALSDGRCAVACRFTDGSAGDAPSLHLHSGKRYHCHQGVPGLAEAELGEHSVIVASEPLTDDPEWPLVPPGHMIVISPEREAEVRRFEPSA